MKRIKKENEQWKEDRDIIRIDRQCHLVKNTDISLTQGKVEQELNIDRQMFEKISLILKRWRRESIFSLNYYLS